MGAKQQQLVSGTNIKTLNGESLLGSGNIVISGGELFNYSWHNGPRSSIDVGRVPTDGQPLLLLTHPDVCVRQSGTESSTRLMNPCGRLTLPSATAGAVAMARRGCGCLT